MNYLINPLESSSIAVYGLKKNIFPLKISKALVLPITQN